MSESTFNGPGVSTEPEARSSLNPQQSGRNTVMDDIRKDLADRAEGDTTTLPLRDKPSYAIRYVTVLDHELVQRLRKKAKNPEMPGGLDEVKYAALILSTYCQAVVRQDVDLVDDNGELVTFGSKFLWDALGAHSTVGAVRKFYGRDSFVLSASTALLQAAGYGDGEMDAGGSDEETGPFGD